MGFMVDSLLWTLQDLYHQQYYYHYSTNYGITFSVLKISFVFWVLFDYL